jgi:LacI family transcriptional regulator
LNFPDKVSPATREKVQTAITTLGYSPNFGARVMAARRTNTIGAIIPTMENAIFARGLQAFQEELRLHGFTMLVASTSYEPALEEEQIRTLIARGADALLLIGHARSAEINKFIDAQSIPTLVTWAFDQTTNRPSVGFDNQTAMQSMAKKVLDQGHTRLALISAPTAHNDRAYDRLQGIKAAMGQANLDPADLQVTEIPYSIENGATAFAQLMQRNPRPTAVFCGNDVLAVGALRQAHEMNIVVPAEISIVGFDNIELAQITYPPLTTVHVPHRDMGRKAAQTLVAMLQNGGDVAALALETSIVLRGTLGPAPTR